MPPDHAIAPAGTSDDDGGGERFIPFCRTDLVDLVEEHGRLAGGEQDRFRAFVELLNAVFHHDFHARLEALKLAYTPFNPDPDTRTIRTWNDEEREQARRQLFDGLRELLERGNFVPVSPQDLHVAFAEESLLELRLEVDHTAFEEVLFFRRGETVREEELTSWFGLRHRTVTFTNYEKVLALVTFRPADDDEEVDEDLAYEPGSTILKLFQDVPRADLEMLYPNAEPRMRPIDKLLIGVPALVSAIIVLVTKALATIGLLLLMVGFWLGLADEPVELDQATLVTLGAGLGSLGGYLVRQVTKFKNRKVAFLKALADNLYFRNLDNDAGVFHHLVDDAEEEEVKEALLAWYFLRVHGPMAPSDLDRTIEAWFAHELEIVVDFDVDDGLAKLRELDLVHDAADGLLEAVTLDDALARLDARWDDYFVYRRTG